MSKKYFVTSDIHSCFSAFKISLSESGFDLTNENHILIILGDIFDRGHETLDVFNFLNNFPKDRLILVKGNHEYCYENLLEKDFPSSYDYQNGTVNTFCSIYGKYKPYELDFAFNAILGPGTPDYENELMGKIQQKWDELREYVKKSPITAFIKDKTIWKDYYELGDFIFVHCFIPVKVDDRFYDKNLSIYGINPIKLTNVPDWREKATPYEWESSQWGCPFTFYDIGLFDDEIKNNKIMVCGHWFTDDFRQYFLSTPNYKTFPKPNPIFYSKHLIALDAATASTNFCNILIIEDNKIYDKDNNEIELKSISEIQEDFKNNLGFQPC